MLVLHDSDIIEEIKSAPMISLDTETTGLYPYQGHELFSIIIATEKKEYYFNYNPNTPPFLKKDNLFFCIAPVFNLILSDPNKIVFMHNAKFDWHFLAKEGIEIKSKVVCTQSSSRLVRNNLMKYSLEALGELIGFPKDDGPKKYMDKEKLFERIEIPGKKQKVKNYHFDQVPLAIMQPYGERDARVTYELGKYIWCRINEQDNELPDGLPRINQVLENEIQLTRVLFEMEREGIKVDKEYIIECLDIVETEKNLAIHDFETMTGLNFKDSSLLFKIIFAQYKLPHGITKKGGASFDKKVLEAIDHPIPKAILQYRDANKRANTYLKNFLYFADPNDLIHCSYNQNVSTGRMSCRDPNMQNINKNADEE